VRTTLCCRVPPTAERRAVADMNNTKRTIVLDDDDDDDDDGMDVDDEEVEVVDDLEAVADDHRKPPSARVGICIALLDSSGDEENCENGSVRRSRRCLPSSLCSSLCFCRKRRHAIYLFFSIDHFGLPPAASFPSKETKNVSVYC
jgi:hypothetical protein